MKCRDAKRALRNLGFREQSGKGSSHIQWKKIKNNRLYKVTLACHKGEVKACEVKSMAAQAGVSRKDFIQASKK